MERETNGCVVDRRTLLGAAGATALGAAAVGLAAAPGRAEAVDPGDQSGAWCGVEPEVPEGQIAETVETEVLVCGAGHAGVPLAYVLGVQGVRTLVIEKAATIGTCRSYIGAIGTTAQQQAGVQCDPDHALYELAHYANNFCSQPLIHLWTSRSGEAVDYFADALAPYGVKHIAISDLPEDGKHGFFDVPDVHTKFVTPDDTFLGNPWSSYLYEEAQAEHGVEFRFETTLVKVVKEDGRVTGAIAQAADGSYVRVNASKGVVLCCGGYASDPELMCALNPNMNDMVVDQFTVYTTGDGIKAGIWAGGMKDPNPSAMLFDRGVGKPGTKGGYPYEGEGYLNMGSQPWLRLNTKGERFCNEAAPYDYTLTAAWAASPQHTCVILWDANYWEHMKSFYTVGCSRMIPSVIEGSDEGMGLEYAEQEIADNIELGLIQQADTIEELAEKLLLPVETTVASVERYNELAEAGYDEDFGKPAKDLLALTTPPYYGVYLGGSLLTTMDGLKIDTQFRVLDAQTYDPIEGLYSIGDNAGGFFNEIYPELYVGVAAGKSLTFAYLLGRQLGGE